MIMMLSTKRLLTFSSPINNCCLLVRLSSSLLSTMMAVSSLIIVAMIATTIPSSSLVEALAAWNHNMIHVSWTTRSRIATSLSSSTVLTRKTFHTSKNSFVVHHVTTLSSSTKSNENEKEPSDHQPQQNQKQRESSSRQLPAYDLGLGKNKPFVANAKYSKMSNTSANNTINNNNISSNKNSKTRNSFIESATVNWVVPDPVRKPTSYSPAWSLSNHHHHHRGSSSQKNHQDSSSSSSTTTADILKQSQFSQPPKTTRRMVPRDEASQPWRKALWDEMHFSSSNTQKQPQQQQQDQLVRPPLPPMPARAATTPVMPLSDAVNASTTAAFASSSFLQSSSMSSSSPPPDSLVKRPTVFYPDIDLSIPESVYSSDGSVDLVYDLLRWEAFQESQREPLLVSFLHSTILNHPSLESSLAFLLANRLQSPAMMISTQLQSLILDALNDNDVFRRSLRADIMAVRDRDPACTCLPDVFLYFKGFHALQSYRVAHVLWGRGKRVLAQYLQSQVSQVFQIDIHPNATLGSGIMLDHGTGIVIGETARVGHNCSILHHVTLGGSGKKGVDRHPQVGNGVLLGAGATLLGPVQVGDGCQVGAGTLVISNLPSHSVAVGVPARVIGSFVDVTEQPSIEMNQMIDTSDNQRVLFASEGI